MLRNSVLLSIFILWVGSERSSSTFAMPRARGSTEVIKDTSINAEPSCEELKAMWRFSKRQSRAAEITNEIPTYRDPFSYNVWEPYYARSRSIGGMRVGTRFRGRPIFGRVVHKPPSMRVQDIAVRDRAFEELTKLYGMQRVEEPRRSRIATAFRLSGGGHMAPVLPQSGSFQHLKELIRTERARELQEQRMAEEVAARAAALKVISDGKKQQQQALLKDRMMLYSDYDLMNEKDDSMPYVRVGQDGPVSFPDLTAPAAARNVEIPMLYDS